MWRTVDSTQGSRTVKQLQTHFSRFNRRRFLASLTAAGPVTHACGQTFAASAARPGLSFGLLADAQYVDAPPAGSRYYREAPARLRQAVEHFNTRSLAFVVHLGDLIDRDWASFDAVLAPLAASRHPVYHVLGNHDFDLADEWKPQVPQRLGLPRRYHYFDRAGLRFVILDTTEVSTYAYPTGSPEQQAGETELKRVQAAGLPQAQSWNSGVSQAQLAWLETACRTARDAGLRVVAFAHHPVLPSGVYNLWNNDDVLRLLSRQSNVVAWFNGHHHDGALARVDAVPFLTLPGIVETPDTNAFAVADIYPDRLVLTGYGRAPSDEWRFTT